MTLAPPSTKKTYRTAEELIRNVNEEAGLQGYALRKDGYKKDKYGEIRKIWLACDRGGKYRSKISEEQRKRQRTSRACDCPWKGYALRSGGSAGLWSLILKDSTHNHQPTSAESHPLHRQLTTNDLSFIAGETRRRIAPHLTTSELRILNPERPIKKKDVYNARTKLRSEKNGPYTRIQSLLEELEGDEWSCLWDVDEWDQLKALAFFHRRSIELLKKFHNIFFMDCTYKTNRYNMPLLIITSTTSCKKTFYVGFAFLKHESLEFYRWGLRALRRQLRDNIDPVNIFGDFLILTDKEDALIAAIGEVFPLANHMLCQWHVHKNILTRVTKAFQDDAEGMARWNQAWFAVLNASTESEFLAAEDALLFLEPTDSSEPLFKYVHREWLQGNSKKKLVKAWTDRYLHYGHKATSVSEGAHGKLKRRLLTRTNDLKSVVTEVQDLIINEQEEIRIHHEEQKMQLQPALRIGLFRYLIGNTSPLALKLMYDQWKMIVDAPTCFQPCTDTFRKTMGLPCKHEIQHCLFHHEALYPEFIDCQWYLDGTDQKIKEPIPRSLVQEPIKVRGKGRPTNQHDTSTRRNPSQFEIAEADARERQRRQRHNQDQEQSQDQSQERTSQSQSQRQARSQGRGQGWDQSQGQGQSQSQGRGQGQGEDWGQDRGQSRSRSQCQS